MAIGGGGRQLGTIRLNVVPREKLLAPTLAREVTLRTWAIFRTSLHFLKSPQFFYPPELSFVNVRMMLPDVPANITPKNIRIICRTI